MQWVMQCAVVTQYAVGVGAKRSRFRQLSASSTNPD